VTSFPAADLPRLRAAAYEGVYPFCGRGPWDSLAHHVARKHRVGSRELKAMLGIPVSHSLTSPAVRDRAREIGRSMPERTEALIEGGRTSTRAADIGPAGTAGRRRGAIQAGKVKGARHGKIPQADLPKIAARISAGERYRDVAADYRCSPSAVWRRVRWYRVTTGEQPGGAITQRAREPDK
jgi:hypothetical protein